MRTKNEALLVLITIPGQFVFNYFHRIGNNSYILIILGSRLECVVRLASHKAPWPECVSVNPSCRCVPATGGRRKWLRLYVVPSSSSLVVRRYDIYNFNFISDFFSQNNQNNILEKHNIIKIYCYCTLFFNVLIISWRF